MIDKLTRSAVVMRLSILTNARYTVKFFAYAGRGALRAVGWPSGQRQQTVNLSARAYVGSNPTPTTIFIDERQTPT